MVGFKDYMADVFIIDDEVKIAEMLRETVSLSGLTASIYTDATLFFEDDQFNDDSIIILDLNMPTMDGIEVIRELSNRNSKASLILMSGYDSSVLNSAEKVAQAYKLHIITSLMKPIHIDELLNVLDNHKNTLNNEVITKKQNGFIPTASDLKQAIINDDLILHFQPQIDIKTGRMSGAEVLLRWQHPQKGLIYPDSFIALAESSDLMGILTSKVLDLAIKRISYQQSCGYQIPLSVNVSANTIRSLELPEDLDKRIHTHKLDPSLLTIEITESALMGELVKSLDILTRIRMKGFTLSIDDFGTGFSSLSQLHRVPFNELKVDKSFVMDMDRDKEAKAIVKTCIMLGHELNMKVVAEGVESETALNMLSEMGCDIAQGYYLSVPMSEYDFQHWIENHPIKHLKSA